MIGFDFKCVLGLAAVLLAAPALSAPAPPVLSPGTWTNEEDRYFAPASAKPDWIGIEIGAGAQARTWRHVDDYGKPQDTWLKGTPSGLQRDAKGQPTIADSHGLRTELRHGAAFTCWMSIKKAAPKADGSDDFTYAGKMALSDQGGRVTSGGGSTGAPPAIFRLRNVIWPAPSTNKPSLVLYVHRPEEPDHAVSYAWADPTASLIGINLRWVQGSCSRVVPGKR